MVYQGRNHDGRYGGGKSGKYGGKKAATTERKKYVAPTANHHDVLFTIMNQSKVFTPSLNIGSRWE